MDWEKFRRHVATGLMTEAIRAADILAASRLPAVLRRPIAIWVDRKLKRLSVEQLVGLMDITHLATYVMVLDDPQRAKLVADDLVRVNPDQKPHFVPQLMLKKFAPGTAGPGLFRLPALPTGNAKPHKARIKETALTNTRKTGRKGPPGWNWRRPYEAVGFNGQMISLESVLSQDESAVGKIIKKVEESEEAVDWNDLINLDDVALVTRFVGTLITRNPHWIDALLVEAQADPDIDIDELPSDEVLETITNAGEDWGSYLASECDLSFVTIDQADQDELGFVIGDVPVATVFPEIGHDWAVQQDETARAKGYTGYWQEPHDEIPMLADGSIEPTFVVYPYGSPKLGEPPIRVIVPLTRWLLLDAVPSELSEFPRPILHRTATPGEVERYNQLARAVAVEEVFGRRDDLKRLR